MIELLEEVLSMGPSSDGKSTTNIVFEELVGSAVMNCRWVY
jgi:hypothetical protein